MQKIRPLPTVPNAIITLVAVLVAVIIFVWVCNPCFSGVSDITVRRFAQTGILLSYAGVLFTSYDIFYGARYTAAEVAARCKVDSVSAQLITARRLQGHHDNKFLDAEVARLNVDSAEAKASLESATKYITRRVLG
jgi:hypothetical protein